MEGEQKMATITDSIKEKLGNIRLRHSAIVLDEVLKRYC